MKTRLHRRLKSWFSGKLPDVDLASLEAALWRCLATVESEGFDWDEDLDARFQLLINKSLKPPKYRGKHETEDYRVLLYRGKALGPPVATLWLVVRRVPAPPDEPR